MGFILCFVFTYALVVYAVVLESKSLHQFEDGAMMVPMKHGLVKYGEKATREPQECLHTQLKEVGIYGFYDIVTQLELAIYLLKNAVVLERMALSSYMMDRETEWIVLGSHITNREPVDVGERERTLQQLQGKATSKIAQVIVR